MAFRMAQRGGIAPVLMFALAAGLPAPALAQPRTSDQERQQQAAFANSMGGIYAGPQAAYVARIGEKMAAAGGLGGRCTFTLINSEIINAFAAPPGCSIYVTRGLLSVLNTEAELAGVLGHEVGHVARKHFARQRNQQVLTGLAAVLVGAVAKSEEIGQLAGKAAQLGTLSYSRSQEYESDAFATLTAASGGLSKRGNFQRFGGLTAAGRICRAGVRPRHRRDTGLGPIPPFDRRADPEGRQGIRQGTPGHRTA